MKSPGFWRQVGYGLLLSAAGAVLFAGLSGLIGSATLLRALIVVLGAAYLALLLHGLRVRIGLVVTLACWIAVTLLLFAFDPRLWAWLLAQVAMVWLVRSLYRYDSLAAAIADAALSGLALATAIATAGYTRSMFLTLWIFFLVQALFVFIPGARAAVAPNDGGIDPFPNARRHDCREYEQKEQRTRDLTRQDVQPRQLPLLDEHIAPRPKPSSCVSARQTFGSRAQIVHQLRGLHSPVRRDCHEACRFLVGFLNSCAPGRRC